MIKAIDIIDIWVTFCEIFVAFSEYLNFSNTFFVNLLIYDDLTLIYLDSSEVPKQEKVKDHPLFETQANSALRHINVTLYSDDIDLENCIASLLTKEWPSLLYFFFQTLSSGLDVSKKWP